MRTNIVIDDDLLAEALRLSGATTKKAAVERGLRLLVQTARQRKALDDLAGLGWEDDLEALRETREY